MVSVPPSSAQVRFVPQVPLVAPMPSVVSANAESEKRTRIRKTSKENETVRFIGSTSIDDRSKPCFVL